MESWFGFELARGAHNGRETLLVVPKVCAEGRPWVWRAEFFGAFPSVDLALVRAGFHVAYCSFSDMYGAPSAVEGMKAYHDDLVARYRLSPKADLFGFSRGGLYACNYAFAYPQDVSSLYLDAPVLDIRLWPGGFGRLPRRDKEWAQCLSAYGLSEEEAAACDDSPLKRAPALARRGVPVVMVLGDSDEAVAAEENGRAFASAFRAAGGDILLIEKPGCRHHPHSLEDPTPVLRFIARARALRADQLELADLLHTWCEGMLARQIDAPAEAGIGGGLMCPACSLIHGRCFQAVHPLLYMAKKRGEPRFARAAEALLRWSDHMRCPDGGYVNDAGSAWKGITVFACTALLKSYALYRDQLSAEAADKMLQMIRGCLHYLYHVFNARTGNINYLAGAACALQLGGEALQESAYCARAREYARELLTYRTPGGLLCGEGGKPWNAPSAKGCVNVDIGYNLEETVGLLAQYAESAGDQEVLEAAVGLARAHLPFMLPDGGMDNSFGTRMDKWTYWGSRTSDGSAGAFLPLSSYAPELYGHGMRSLRLMRACTADGLLHGGPGLKTRGEPPCLHHTFTHAEGLVEALEWLDEHPDGADAAAEAADGTTYFPELDTYVYNGGGFRATLTGYDAGYKRYCHPTGGALSLLYHARTGPLLVSSMARFERYELLNTQRHLDGADTPLTLRLQKRSGIYPPDRALPPLAQLMGESVCHASMLDKSARVEQTGEGAFRVNGRLTDDEGKDPACGPVRCQMEYRFLPDRVLIDVRHDGEDVDLYLPLVAPSSQKASVQGSVCTLYKGGATVRVTASQPFDRAGEGRIFSHVPGMEALPLRISGAAPNLRLEISVEAEAAL